MAVAISAAVSIGVHVPLSISVLTSGVWCLLPLLKSQLTVLPLFPYILDCIKQILPLSDNNVTFILTLLCDLISFLRSLTPLG